MSGEDHTKPVRRQWVGCLTMLALFGTTVLFGGLAADALLYMSKRRAPAATQEDDSIRATNPARGESK